ncbi:biogenesis of lysosome-related organelles complex 1 subunit 4 [Halyomorpha halys]|uniref:biogenesis of lysosome-related organelles complex 1 subunit 4 n=1 Tax=Halyomorpha halys TaxID=286706 RepID=UPI0006D4D3BE|nr:uncharacterized protein LOC106682930 [Halyomorpha halys]
MKLDMSEEAGLLIDQYAGYLKVDMSCGVKTIEESIDETLTRLDEYSSLIDMVRAESSVQKCNSLLSSRDDLQVLFEKVKKLEFMVARIKQDVYRVEALVDKAESDLGISTEGKLKHFLKPFFRRTNTEPQERTRAKFEPPELFTTKDFLK